ncbi:hypothetical protein FHG87_018492 [Trinorchestia longiramus]|nr:hypothetical protein FHG87_018492 [Trinorchestia longiramus]
MFGVNVMAWNADLKKLEVLQNRVEHLILGATKYTAAEASLGDLGLNEAARRKFESRRDLALALIVLGVDQSQLYLLGDPTDPVEVWRKPQNTFQKKSWANKFRLKKKLFNMKMENGQNLQDHLKISASINSTSNDLIIYPTGHA